MLNNLFMISQTGAWIEFLELLKMKIKTLSLLSGNYSFVIFHSELGQAMHCIQSNIALNILVYKEDILIIRTIHWLAVAKWARRWCLDVFLASRVINLWIPLPISCVTAISLCLMFPFAGAKNLSPVVLSPTSCLTAKRSPRGRAKAKHLFCVRKWGS